MFITEVRSLITKDSQKIRAPSNGDAIRTYSICSIDQYWMSQLCKFIVHFVVERVRSYYSTEE